MAFPNITPLPAAPNPDNPASFNTLAYPYTVAYRDSVPEFNAFINMLNSTYWPNMPSRSMIDGTAAAPAWTWDTDPDTGAYRIGANQIGFSAGGTRRASISPTAMQIDVPVTGTAVTQSNIDSTAGRLTKVGDFGLGGIPPIIGNMSVVDNSIATGFYTYATASGSTGGPSGTLFGHVIHQRRTTGGGEFQTMRIELGTSPGAPGTVWTRFRGTGAWSAWDMEFSQGNAVGPVSQSGGLPTGALIESAGTANGRYLKFADGTMICSVTRTLTQAANYYCRYSWPFPAEFASAPHVVVTSQLSTAVGYGISTDRDRWGAASATTVSASSAILDITRSHGAPDIPTGASISASAYAIGRWYA